MSFSESPTFTRNQGCATSVLVSAFLTASGFGIVFLATGGGGAAVIAFIVAFVGAIPIIGLAAAVIGLPLTRILESNGWERPWSYPLAGFAFGAIIVAILLQALGPPPSWTIEVLAFLLVGAFPGALCGALWWRFERRHARQRMAGEHIGRLFE